MKIEHCSLSSVQECLAIARDVALTPDRNVEQGFLLDMPEEAAYLRLLHAQALWVCQQQERIVGFVIAYPSSSSLYAGMTRALAQIVWEERAVVETERLVYIDKVATRPNQQRQGIARALYEHLFMTFAAHGFWAGIAEQPFANTASAAFHVRLGFRRVGTFRADELAGITGYASGIYFRAAVYGPNRRVSSAGGR